MKRFLHTISASLVMFLSACNEPVSEEGQLPAQTVTFAVEISGDDVEITDGGNVTAFYKVNGVEGDLTVEAMVGDGWSASVEETSDTEGYVKVCAPNPITAEKVLVSFSDASGRRIVRSLRLIVKSNVKRGNIETFVFAGLNYSEIDPALVDDATALRRFQQVVDAGVQVMYYSVKYNWLHEDWSKEALVGLDLAEKVGLKLALYTESLIGYDDLMESFVMAVKDHPALWGYILKDEPSEEYFGLVEKARQAIRKYDKVHPMYVNLNGYGCSPQTYHADSFDEYLDMYLTETTPEFISFDVYPCYSDMVLDGSLYPSLEIVSKKSQAAGLDFWAFAATCRFSNAIGELSCPSVATLRFQDYTNLAYGAQGLEYFTWDAVSDPRVSVFCDWPVDPEGNINTENPTFESMQTVNREVQNRAFVFDGCVLKWAAHHNDVPVRCNAVDASQLPDEIMSYSSESDLLMTLIENDGGKSEYLNIVSRTHLRSSEIHLRFRYPVQTVERDGSLKSYNAGDYDFVIEPGDILIIKTR